MNKPKKLTKEQLDAKIAKAKPRRVREFLSIPASGTLLNWNTKLGEFCAKWNIGIEDLSFYRWYYGATVSVFFWREETPEEITKRVRSAEQSRYNIAKRRYDWWLREEETEQARLARQNRTTCCCPSTCCCRRGYN